MRHNGLVGLAAVACLALAGTPAFAQVNIADSFDTTDGTSTTPTRLFRDAVTSACGAPKAFPGTFGADSYAYKTHTLVNSGPAQCVTIDVTANCPGAAPQVHAIVYDGAFNPADISDGYLADIGSSTGDGTTYSMGVDLAAGQSVDLVLQGTAGTASAAGVCTYTIVSSQLADPAAVVPTLQEWAMILLGGLMAATGAFVVWRRRSGLA
ncbi:IPTL-CTERM sorting domain-containing protein [Brevundimonas lutea]|uniref:IPTL-CTERM sorting domain-containing protein n=1 Tax=Brevundimonas lutea TaxID=2293980 RepID=UPI000F037825|nr:IPTL-CTERM sorting domain-containing protein [Brevundimonas lutea]